MRHDLFFFKSALRFYFEYSKFYPHKFFFSKLTVLANEFQQMVRKFNFSVIQRHYLNNPANLLIKGGTAFSDKHVTFMWSCKSMGPLMWKFFLNYLFKKN